ncbi:MAG: helix-turn-helix domain-containing protein [Rhodospirillales bacterium]|nr:helix-turn-helix domain-containing protein [Rhodospirillales bacterium]
MADQDLKIGIGALSRQTGCNVETIRYYEKIGLMNAPDRTEGGHREFGYAELKRLSFIRRGRGLGFSINKIRAFLALVDGGDLSCTEVKSITEEHLGDVRRKLADLKKLEGVLEIMVAQCSGNEVPDCPVIDALYDAA